MANVVVITGASRGFGLAVAHYFADKGWQVAATMRNTEMAQELDVLPQVRKYRLDVEDEASIHAAHQAILNDFGRVDVLINNAGFGVFQLTETVPLDSVRKQLGVNLIGTVAVTQAFLPTMRTQNSGTIVNVTSIIGHVAVPLSSFYAATKWALEGYSESLSFELKPFNIKVRSVAPGAFATDFAEAVERAESFPDQRYATFSDKVFRAINDPKYFGDPRKVPPVIYKAATHPSRKFKRFIVGVDARVFWFIRRRFGGAFQRWVVGKYMKV